MIAILGGLGAAGLWATATLCSSRSSRMLGSRVVLAWIMIVGVVVGLPIAVVSAPPVTMAPSTIGLLLLSGSCYVIGLQVTYSALRIGKVSIPAVMGSQFAALAAVAAFVLFGERLGRIQIAGVALIGVGVTVLAGVSA